MLQLYDKLLRFPLFLGLGSEELTQIVGHTKFDFRKLEAGAVVARQGEPCRHLHLLDSGQLLAVTDSEGAWRVEEQIAAPYTFQMESVYGLPQRYRSTFKTMTDASFIVIDKRELTRLCSEYIVIRTNFINFLSTLAQRQLGRPWRDAPLSLRERIARTLADRCISPLGRKTFHVMMEQMAVEVNDSRRNVSHTLHEMEADQVLALHRGRIEVDEIGELR